MTAAAPAKDMSTITIAYSGYATSNDYWNGLGKAAAAEAAAKGVKFVGPATTVQSTATHELKLREFFDPDGNALALMGMVAK